MEVLVTATIKKEDMAGKVSAIANELGELNLLFDRSTPGFHIDQEWKFGQNGIVGKFHIFQDGPEIHFGKASLHMIFENVLKDQFEELEEIVQKHFANTEFPLISVMARKPVVDYHLSRILSSMFIDSLGLNLRRDVGLAISSEHMKLEILNNFQMNSSVYGKVFFQLGEKSILELSQELEYILESILAFQGKRVRTRNAKVISRLSNSDLGWWNVVGTEKGGTTCYTEQGDIKHYTAEASAGFKTLEFRFSNLFQKSFLDIFEDVTAIDLVKEKGGKKYWLSFRDFSGHNSANAIIAKVTIKKNLGTEKKYSIDVGPEIIRLNNAIYNSLIESNDTQKIFIKHIKDNANETCICGRRFEDSLDEDIVEMGCGHLLHRSCWIAWKNKNKPRKFDWDDSFCPFCDDDCSVYNVLWTPKRLVWKHTGP